MSLGKLGFDIFFFRSHCKIYIMTAGARQYAGARAILETKSNTKIPQ
jgi:hypothetical protein